jgi:hypothetical protein
VLFGETAMTMTPVRLLQSENAKLIGKLGNRFGGMIEDMVIPGLVAKFRELGFVFNEAYPHADRCNDKRTYLGAVAGMAMSESVKKHAMKKGFYVIEPSGEDFYITEPKGIYSPREW